MVSVIFVSYATAQANFVGKYEFFEDGGKTAGGDNIWVGHYLQIKADGEATLTANGFQTAKDLICTGQNVRYESDDLVFIV